MQTIRDAGLADVVFLGSEGGGVLVAAYDPRAATVALTYATAHLGSPPSHVKIVSGVRRPFWWSMVLASPAPAAALAERSLEAAARQELATAAGDLGLSAEIHVVGLARRIETVVARLLAARDYAFVAIGSAGRDRRAQRLCQKAQAWCPAELVPAPPR